MDAFLIDPFNKSITPVQYSGNWEEIAPMLDCQYFTTIQLNDDDDVVFVDDEGLMKDQTHMKFFSIQMAPDVDQVIAGKGLVLGTDKHGETTSPLCSARWLSEVIGFPDDPRIPSSKFKVYVY